MLCKRAIISGFQVSFGTIVFVYVCVPCKWTDICKQSAKTHVTLWCTHTRTLLDGKSVIRLHTHKTATTGAIASARASRTLENVMASRKSQQDKAS